MSDGSRIIDSFAARCVAWTGRLPRGRIEAIFVPWLPSGGLAGDYRALLSARELERGRRFGSEDDRRAFEQRRAFRRFCAARALGRVPVPHFVRTRSGRPYLPDHPDVWFSFASCRAGALGVWSATHAVGVDAEDRILPEDVHSLASSHFTAGEARRIGQVPPDQRVPVFARLWTLKEAALKSIGEGLPFGLDTFAFMPDSPPRVETVPDGYGGPASFLPWTWSGSGLSVSIVARKRTAGPGRS